MLMNNLRNYFTEKITITPTRGGLCLLNILFIGCGLLAVRYADYAFRHDNLGISLLEALGVGIFATIGAVPFFPWKNVRDTHR
jgi:hypothetical protein